RERMIYRVFSLQPLKDMPTMEQSGLSQQGTRAGRTLKGEEGGWVCSDEGSPVGSRQRPARSHGGKPGPAERARQLLLAERRARWQTAGPAPVAGPALSARRVGSVSAAPARRTSPN